MAHGCTVPSVRATQAAQAALSGSMLFTLPSTPYSMLTYLVRQVSYRLLVQVLELEVCAAMPTLPMALVEGLPGPK